MIFKPDRVPAEIAHQYVSCHPRGPFFGAQVEHAEGVRGAFECDREEQSDEEVSSHFGDCHETTGRNEEVL